MADAGLQPPDDAASTFDLLGERGWISSDVADVMRAAAGLRNRIAHGYADLDHERLHAEAKKSLELVRRFLVEVARSAGL